MLRGNIEQCLVKIVEMKKKAIIFAILVLAAIPVWIWGVVPELEKLPEDFFFTADIVSTNDFYDEENKEFSGEQYFKTEYQYKAVSSDRDSLVVKNIFIDRTRDKQPFFSIDRLYGIDRKTGAHTPEFGDKKREGYLFAPRHLSKEESFTYWSINYDVGAVMKFVGEETVYGLRVFRYETYYKNTRIDETAYLGFLPGVGTERGIELEPHLELWVEPVTGRLIKYKDTATAYYYNLQTRERLHPWDRFSNTFQEESIERNVESALWEKMQSLIIEIYIPLFLLVIALFSLVGGSRIIVQMKRIANSDSAHGILPIFIIVCGVLVIVGWIVGSEGVVRFFWDRSAMNPLTAFCFIILGLGVLFKNMVRGRIAMLSGIVLVTLACLRILAFYGIIPFDIDLVFFGERLLEIPSRMELYVAFLFLLLGIALLSEKSIYESRFYIIEIITATISLFSLLVFYGYLFLPLNIVTYTPFLNVAFDTAILLLFSSIVIFMLSGGGNGSSLSSKNSMILFGLVSSTVFITVIIAGFVGNSFTNDAHTSFESAAERTKALIESRLAIYINALEGGKGLFVSSQEVKRDAWKSYVEALNVQGNYPGIQGMGYAPFVSADERDTHIAKIRTEGFPEYTIYPSGIGSLYVPVIYLEPFDERNRRAFGFDLFSEKVRRSGLEQARDTGSPKMTGKITPIQETEEDIQPGFFIYVPLYENGVLAGTVDERRKSIVGYIHGVFRARDFFEGIIGKQGLEGIALRVHDGTSVSEEAELYDDTGKKIESGATARFSTTKTIYTGGRSWMLTFKSTPDYGETLFSHYTPYLIIVFGIMFGVFIALIFYREASSRQKAIIYAGQVTLSQEKAKDEAILASIADGLVAVDIQGKIVLTNDAFAVMLEWKPSETQGKLFTEIITMTDEDGKILPASEHLISKTIRERIRTIRTITTKYYKKKNGTIFPVAISVSPIIRNNEFIGAVEVFRDITKEKEIDKAKTEFVSLASHQLRTPLSTVNWYTEMLLAGDAGNVSSVQKKYLEEIYTGNQRMVALVNDLLNVSRLELGTFVIEPEPINLTLLMESVVEEQKPQINVKNIRISFSFEKDIPVIQADPKLLRMVAQNLLSNAGKYTPYGGTIELSLSLDMGKKNILLKVSDTGYGIPKNQQNKIFTKLFRADNVKEQNTEGTGLGLYIVKSIIEHSGGRIWFESAENKGTTFYVALPVEGMKKREGKSLLS